MDSLLNGGLVFITLPAFSAGLFVSQVVTVGGVPGTIESAFGKSGKFRVRFEDRLPPPSPDQLESSKLTLTFKKYVYGDKKCIAQ
jgi:hypothetical protein